MPNLIARSTSTQIAALTRHAEMAKGALSPNTERALSADTAIFASWCESQSATSLPARPETVAAFCDAQAEIKAPATIRRYVASIAYMHRAAELEDPTKTEAVKLAIKRMSRAKGTRQQQAAPITAKVADRMTEGTGSGLNGSRDRALVLVMRDLLARRSEVVALNVGDVAFADGTATVLIRRSKTDQAGKGELRMIGPGATMALREWIEAAAVTDGALFRSLSRRSKQKRLPAGDVARILKRLAKGAGIDPADISGHSCRVGMAHDLVAHGCDLVEVMTAGRWKTASMPARYTERLAAKRGAVAKFYGVR